MTVPRSRACSKPFRHPVVTLLPAARARLTRADTGLRGAGSATSVRTMLPLRRALACGAHVTFIWKRHANWHADGGDMHAAIGAREERLFDENQVMDWFAQARFACIDHAVHAIRAPRVALVLSLGLTRHCGCRWRWRLITSTANGFYIVTSRLKTYSSRVRFQHPPEHNTSGITLLAPKCGTPPRTQSVNAHAGQTQRCEARRLWHRESALVEL